jgi:hypothetical protein
MQGTGSPVNFIKPMFEIKGGSLLRITDAIDNRTAPEEVMKRVGPTGDQFFVQKVPFFIWFGPHIPHDGPNTDDFGPLYDDGALHKEELHHYRRVSWLDAVIGGLEYHLKRSCSCDRDGNLRSLWDNTVFIFLTDQGFLLPNAKRNSRENTQRTPLLISAPEHRDASTSTPEPAVYDEELASSIDLVPTILAYAGTASGEAKYFNNSPDTNRTEYPHGRSLKVLIDKGATHADWLAVRRKLAFGEQGTDDVGGNKDTTSGFPRHLVTRPHLLGVCQTPHAFTSGQLAGTSHVHPCLEDADCPSGLGPCTCETPSGSCTGSTGKWKRCVNKPGTKCSSDDDCAPAALCSGSPAACVDTAMDGWFRDFAGKPCAGVGGTATPTLCVPKGVCRPLVLKAESKNWNTLGNVWDVEWDPDQTKNLLQDGYLPDDPGALRSKFVGCIKAYATLDSAKNFRWDKQNVAGLCPSTWGMADWD